MWRCLFGLLGIFVPPFRLWQMVKLTGLSWKTQPEYCGLKCFDHGHLNSSKRDKERQSRKTTNMGIVVLRIKALGGNNYTSDFSLKNVPHVVSIKNHLYSIEFSDITPFCPPDRFWRRSLGMWHFLKCVTSPVTSWFWEEGGFKPKPVPPNCVLSHYLINTGWGSVSHSMRNWEVGSHLTPHDHPCTVQERGVLAHTGEGTFWLNCTDPALECHSGWTPTPTCRRPGRPR